MLMTDNLARYLDICSTTRIEDDITEGALDLVMRAADDIWLELTDEELTYLG